MNSQIEALKCAVKDCTNHAHNGLFVGLLCSPCHAFIAGNGGLHSQAYRNSRNMIDAAIALEREACAKVCDGMGDATRLDYVGHGAAKCAVAIRARGQE